MGTKSGRMWQTTVDLPRSTSGFLGSWCSWGKFHGVGKHVCQGETYTGNFMVLFLDLVLPDGLNGRSLHICPAYATHWKLKQCLFWFGAIKLATLEFSLTKRRAAMRAASDTEELFDLKDGKMEYCYFILGYFGYLISFAHLPWNDTPFFEDGERDGMGQVALSADAQKSAPQERSLKMCWMH